MVLTNSRGDKKSKKYHALGKFYNLLSALAAGHRPEQQHGYPNRLQIA